MCGIAGIVSTTENSDSIKNRIENMKQAINHRGPDGHGTSIFTTNSGYIVGLGHQRLAIIDPNAGKQPMASEDGNITIIFNGAIYNYLELRRELIAKGAPIKSYSDTEVIIYAYLEWGQECVHKLRGMFAFAIWDKNNSTLFCARDRVGIKPFYYSLSNNNFIFASEIKAILAANIIKAEPDYNGIQDYLTFQYCIGSKTLFKNILCLEPGYTLTIKTNQQQIVAKPKKYWDLEFKIQEGFNTQHYATLITTTLEDAVRIHLRSDVPVGAHLSGGIDSSAIVGIAAKMLKDVDFKTFTGAFSESKNYDETEYAKAVAANLQVDYHEIFMNCSKLADYLPKIIYHMDQPTAGPGVIPQYFVSKYAGNHVKVVLGGQGGDELFAGYARYAILYLEACLHGAINGSSDKSSNYISDLQGMIESLPVLKSYIPTLKSFWSNGLFDSFDQRYFRLVDRTSNSESLICRDNFSTNYSPFNEFSAIFNKPGIDSLINKMLYYDFKTSLPALLHVEDRTSMAAALESRVPILDHELVELAATIPPKEKFANGNLKALLKKSVKEFIPKVVLERKDKMGFPVPLQAWMQGQSKEYVHDILRSTKARQRGIFNSSALDSLLEKEQDYGRTGWGILCLELWFNTFIDQDSAAIKPSKDVEYAN